MPLPLPLTLTRPDEAECQIKCGDEFSNEVVGDFTKCAVTDKKCVPQRGDDGTPMRIENPDLKLNSKPHLQPHSTPTFTAHHSAFTLTLTLLLILNPHPNP